MWWLLLIKIFLLALVLEGDGAFKTTFLIRRACLERGDSGKCDWNIRNVFAYWKKYRRQNRLEKKSLAVKCLEVVNSITDNIEKYQYLRNLQNRDEDLFYSCLIKYVNELLPIVYTPVVGEVCENYDLIYGPKRGFTLPISEEDNVEDEIKKLKKMHPQVKAIVVTDGGRILGLGDLGANGMGIPVGKMAIYTALGGIHPKHCLPVTLDVGTNNKKLRQQGRYVGLNLKRVEGVVYERFVDSFMASVAKVFGPNTLVQFEDFGNENAFLFLRRYRERYTMFNDDIQGTAAAALAGILAAERFTNKKLQDAKVLFVGAGEAGIGIANLMVEAMKEIGINEDEARGKIYFKRSKSLILSTEYYPDDDDRRLYRKSIPKDVPMGANTEDLLEIIKWLKPNILIGVSSTGGLFTEQVLKEMKKHNEEPIIFPLSNPVHKSECTAKQAYEHTEGKVLFASGSPFEPVMVDGKLKEPQQCNNAYIFPGVAMGIVAAQMTKVPDKVFLIAAETLAKKCTQQRDFERGSLFPRLEVMRECSLEIATEIAKYAFKEGLSSLKNKPKDGNVKQFIRNQQYIPSYLK